MDLGDLGIDNDEGMRCNEEGQEMACREENGE